MEHMHSSVLNMLPLSSSIYTSIHTQTVIMQNILLSENVSCSRSLNYFVNSLIYLLSLIVSVMCVQLTLHCTDEQPPGQSITWLLWVRELLSSENSVSAVGWNVGLLAKPLLIHAVETDLCYCKNQVIRAATPLGNYATLMIWLV